MKRYVWLCHPSDFNTFLKVLNPNRGIETEIYQSYFVPKGKALMFDLQNAKTFDIPKVNSKKSEEKK